MRHLVAEHFDGTCFGYQLTGKHLDCGRLACAVRAEDAQNLTGVNVEADVVHGPGASVGERETLRGDGLVGHRSVPLVAVKLQPTLTHCANGSVDIRIWIEFQAILDAKSADLSFPADPVVVISDRPGVQGTHEGQGCWNRC